MGKQELQTIQQLLGERYHRTISPRIPIALIVIVAVVGAVTENEFFPMYLALTLAMGCQLVFGAGYRRELSRLWKGFRLSYWLTVVLFACWAMIGIALVIIRIAGDSVRVLTAVIYIMPVIIAVIAIVRTISYYTCMNRMSEDIAAGGGTRWLNLRKKYIVAVLLLCVIQAALLGGIFYKLFLSAGFEGGGELDVVARIFVFPLFLIFFFLFGIILTGGLLLVFALFKRKWECEVAEETMFLIDRTIRRGERPAGPYPAQSSPK